MANVDWFFISHRLVIAEEAMKNGFEVVVAAEDTGRGFEIANKGIEFINLPLSRSGTNPIHELYSVLQIYKLYNNIKPDILHHITLKPVIYGSVIAKFLNIKNVINAVSGLGYNFTEGRINIISKIMIRLMKIGFSNKTVFIFQNKDDFKELLELKVLSPESKIYFIKGSGVNLKEFYPCEFPSFDRINVLLPSRMLWDKGVNEFHEAATLLKSDYFNKVQFILAGIADNNNKAGVTAKLLNSWNDNNYFKWIGHQNDIIEVYRNSHIVVLPSYREGMPKSLIEACAMGRAIITTEAIGCQECVDEGKNGLKVPIKDAQSLANAIRILISSPEKIIDMGIESRIKAENEFSIDYVISKHIKIYNNFK